MTVAKVRVVGFGARLRRLREARGWTQRELSRRAGLSVAPVCRYELENGLPDSNALCGLAEALGVTTDELLGRRVPGAGGTD